MERRYTPKVVLSYIPLQLNFMLCLIENVFYFSTRKLIIVRLLYGIDIKLFTASPKDSDSKLFFYVKIILRLNKGPSTISPALIRASNVLRLGRR